MSGTAVRDRPIIFSGPMVKAILEGRKTMTRRTIPGVCDGSEFVSFDNIDHGFRFRYPSGNHGIARCKYGKRGERLWVREAWWLHAYFDGTRPRYVATDKADPRVGGGRVRSPIHMPRWASRLTLEITSVRVERLQSITEADAIAEGVDAISMADVPRQATLNRRDDFAQLWDKINGKRHPWALNPFVWVIAFKVVKEDAQ